MKSSGTKPKGASNPAPLHPVEQYAADVLAGRVLVNKWVRLAVERHRRDLIEGHKRGLRFNPEAAVRVLAFFAFARHSKGEWAGQIVTLEPWQKFIIWVLFGWERKDSKGRWVRRFKKALIEIARKNGKSTFMSVLGIFLLLGDGEMGAEVYSVATMRDQARIVHEEAMRMVKASPDLAAVIKVFRDNMSIVETNSKFEPLGADSDKQDGLNISAAIVDELHAHKNRAMLDVIDTATGARAQPLILMITTAGSSLVSPWATEHDYAEKILEGKVPDDAYFAIIYSIDEGDDWRDETVWIKANPNLGVSVSLDDLRAKRDKAKEMPAAQNDFIRLHMNRRTQQITRWLSIECWDKSGGGKPFDLAMLLGRRCFGGLDLSTTIDLTAFVLIFPPIEEDPLWYLLPRFFAPRETALAREKRDRAPYLAWESTHEIDLTEGDAVDYAVVKNTVIQASELYQVIDVGFDKWNAAATAQELVAAGVACVEFGQGMAAMNGPTKEFERLLLKGLIAHGGNKPLRWMAGNVAVQMDGQGNYRPCKQKSTEKIDGIVASIMALGRAMASDDKSRSVYETRGIVEL